MTPEEWRDRLVSGTWRDLPGSIYTSGGELKMDYDPLRPRPACPCVVGPHICSCDDEEDD